MKTSYAPLLLATVLGAMALSSALAQTDGSVTFRVTTQRTFLNYDPKNVMAIWVTGTNGTFVKTLKKQAQTRQQYLYQWLANSKTNVVDAITGATLATQQTHIVTWNCRNASGTLMPDGVYRIRVEMTTQNAQGAISPSNHIQFTKGPSPVTLTPTNLQFFTDFSLTYTPAVTTVHDVAVMAIAPTNVGPETTTPISITVSNVQTTPETFNVILSNMTSRTSIGTQTVSSLPAHSIATVSIPWSTVGVTSGVWSLRATAVSVPGETLIANNTMSTNVTVRAVLKDVEVTDVEVSGEATVGDVLNVGVTVRNFGNTPVSFPVVLADTTRGTTIAMQTVSNLAAQASTLLRFEWNTLGNALGPHTLTAQAGPLAGETNAANNVRAVTASIVTTGFGLSPMDAVGALGGSCSAVALNGDTLLAGLGSSLYVLRPTTTGTLTVVSRLRLPGMIVGIAAAGGVAYTANGDAGVHVVDLMNPEVPRHVSTFDTSGNAYAVAVSGSRLYVAAGSAGFRTLDISIPLTPVLVGSAKTEGPIRALAVVGTTLYAVDRYVGLRIFDVANPSAPVLKGTQRIGFGNGVAVAGSTAYVVDGGGILSTINVAQPNAPVLLGTLTLAGPGRALALTGATAIIACGDAGLQWVNIAAPAAPASLAVLNTPGEAEGVAVDGSTVYVADALGGLRIVNAANPVTPLLVGGYGAAHRAVDVAISDVRSYVAAGEAGLFIYSVAQPATPVLLGVATNVGNARGVAVSGNLAFVADGQFGLRTLNITDAAHPSLLSTYLAPGMGPVRRVTANGTTVLAADGQNVYRLDMSNPATPKLQATYAAPSYIFDLASASNLAVVAAGIAGVVVLDVTDPSGLPVLATYRSPGPAIGVHLSGLKAYVAEGQAGWLILDLSQPSAPTLTSAFGTPASAIAVDNQVAGVARGSTGLTLFDITKPMTPVNLESVGPLISAMRVAAFGGYTYVAEEEAGVGIFQATAWAGIPVSDDWKQQIVDANPTDDIRSLADVLPNDDFDRDGLTNLQEYIAGTSPIDASSVFEVGGISPPSGGGFVIRWHSVPDRTYILHKSTNLLEGFTVKEAGLPATPPMNTYTDTTATTGPAFYFVVIKEP